MKIRIIKTPDGDLTIPSGATFEEAKKVMTHYIKAQINRITLNSVGKDKDYIDRELEKYLPFAKYLSYEKSNY